MLINNDEFSFIAELLKKETAIVLDESKKYLAESRLRQLLLNEDLASVNNLISIIRATDTQRSLVLRKKVVDSLTTNETYFFRDPEAFSLLNKVVLPEIRKIRNADNNFKIWSAACSSGQEPYSLAMQFAELKDSPWNFSIYATDICEQVLEKAKMGTYQEFEVKRGLTQDQIDRHFDKSGDIYKIKPGNRDRIDFQYFNLIGNWEKLPMFDVIFLRNVMIYFDKEVKSKILNECLKKLKPKGFLFLGSTETTLGLSDKFVKVAPQGGCYAKCGDT